MLDGAFARSIDRAEKPENNDRSSPATKRTRLALAGLNPPNRDCGANIAERVREAFAYGDWSWTTWMQDFMGFFLSFFPCSNSSTWKVFPMVFKCMTCSLN